MPRDSNGNYTLPAGNPVVPNTLIEASWANPTMDDLAAAMTDSLSRSGQGGMLGQFLFADGSQALPSSSWTNETSAGWYRAGPSDFRYTMVGGDIFLITFEGLAMAPDNLLRASNLGIKGVGAAALLLDAPVNVTGIITAVSGIFTGDVSALNGIFTGDVSALSGTFTGDVSALNGIFTGNVSGVSGIFTGDVSGASGTFTGAVTSGGVNLNVESLGWALSDEATPVVVGLATTDRVPYALTITAVRASLTTAQGGGALFTVNILKNGVSILSTPITIDNGARTSVGATTPPVIATPAFADDDEISFDVTQVGDATAAGAKVRIVFART